ncbi:uncharacterized protein LOC126801197 [Argentina anserina]|uniref:uncharacterized protein LOC126801197 n=1 Tax=Argentina anserina TaxID=57926 RepID=UPI002176551C|nr:uncharacterized protein LOC126801197 [Potentilla anserina]
MNAQAIKEIKARNEEASAKETKVNKVDNRSSAGQGQEQRNVQVIHQSHPSPIPNTSGGVLTGAAAAVASTLKSAKEAISKND